MKDRVAVVLGTRPEIIKLSALIRLLKKNKRRYILIHTGQHYSYDMDERFFKELHLPRPDYKFSRPAGLGSNLHLELVNWIKKSVQQTLKKERPSAVLIQGDTDTVLAGAQAAADVGGITIGHVEAGLRSFDRSMPEERNRIEADRLSHILFAPTESARRNLVKEKFASKHIVVTGNTIVDALFENLKLAEKHKKSDPFQKGYALVTLHRPESVDNKERLENVIRALKKLIEKRIVHTVIFPLHPRTRRQLGEFGISLRSLNKAKIVTPGPFGFLDFLWHEKNADIILTDSGGVQEEACILKVPCVTIRTSTERPETVKAGANIVAGYEPDKIISAALRMMEKKRNWPNPFGDGKASERILETLDAFL